MSNISINIQPISKSRLDSMPSLENVAFGKNYSDHMLIARYENGAWQDCEIRPYGDIPLAPSTSALHYGQAIFEGMKAFKKKGSNEVGIFRIDEHFNRINASAGRLQMPHITEEIFIGGMKKLIDLDRNWVPGFDDHSLYIRPFMFATDNFLGVRASEKYYFMVITSPSASYYSKAINVIVQSTYSRAAKGGVGGVKAAGNYAASLFPTQLAIKEGYDQVLWTDADRHELVQEVGTMNIFFVLKGKVVTPSTSEETILKGITRKSTIHLLQSQGKIVEEREIHIKELIDGYKSGDLTEIFGTGTAVVVNPVAKMKYEHELIDLSGKPTPVASAIKKDLTDIRYGTKADAFGWMTWM